MTPDDATVDLLSDRGRLTDAELIGTHVETASGDTVGIVVDLIDDRLVVQPSSNLLKGLSSWLCCPWERWTNYPIREDAIDRIEHQRIVLKSG